jgi:hypothetical protein
MDPRRRYPFIWIGLIKEFAIVKNLGTSPFGLRSMEFLIESINP